MRGDDPAPAETTAAAAPSPPAGLVLELEVPPGSLGGVLRGAALSALRAGQARSTLLRLTWYDTADGALAARGQVLELAPERRGTRQTLRQVLPPETETWCPGTASPALAETVRAAAAPDPVAAGLPPGTPLVALAAAEGHRRRLKLLVEGQPASLVVLEGRLRTVAAEQDFTRLQIIAPGSAAFGIALQLSEDVAMLPARPLAEAARALALAETPRAPRRGAPALSAEMRVEDGFVHAMLHLSAVLLWLVPAVRAGEGVEPVHQARVALRRLRSALAVWRAAIDGDGARALDAGLRDLVRRLGPVRDRDVFLGGMLAELEDAIAAEGVEAGDRLALLRGALARQRSEAHRALADWLDSPAFAALILALLAQCGTRGWRAGADAARLEALERNLPDFAAQVLRQRSRKLTKDHEALQGVPIAVLHALRLKAKRLRYAAEFFAPLFPAKRTRRYLRRLARLQAALGIVNDGAVAGGLVRSLPPARASAAAARTWAQGAVDGFAAARAAAARGEAEDSWQALRRAEPFWTG